MNRFQIVTFLRTPKGLLTQAVSYFLISSIALSMSFTTNAFGAASPEFFEQWQLDSDGIVVQSILGRGTGQSYLDWGLARNQQIGSQGHFFFLVSALSGFVDFEFLRFLSAILTGIFTAAVGTQILYSGKLSLAVIWGVVALASPWFVSAAKNLYWIPWSWMLPIAIVGWMYFAKSEVLKIVLHALLFLALVFRFASGYEFVSAILLMTAFFPIVLSWAERQSLYLQKQFFFGVSSPLMVGVTGSSAFLLTFLVHASMRVPGNIVAGIVEIFEQDVLRRTHGDPFAFDPAFSGSLQSDTWGVVLMYFNGWWTPFLELRIPYTLHLSIGEFGLWALLAFIAITSMLRLLFGDKLTSGFIVILIVAISIPVSWFALAKGHSAIHAHINYVLWYPMPISLLLYLVWLNLRSITGAFRSYQVNRKKPSY